MSLNAAIDIQLTPLESALMTDLELLAQVVRKQGYSCRAFSPKSLVILRAQSEEKKILLAKQIKNILQIVLFSPEIANTDEHVERRYVDQALKMYDLECEIDFWSSLQKDDVIEVYSSENIQLFRTFNFFKISSYSLLDLLTNEWYHLWERPSFALDIIMNAVEGVVTGRVKKTMSLSTAGHIVKEIYNDESINFKCSSVLVEPVVISPLYAKGTKDVKGFLFTLRGKVVGYDSDSNKIAVI